MRLCFFEDHSHFHFAPLTLLRPVFELICGRFSLRERLIRAWNVEECGAILRPHLVASYRESEPDLRLNDRTWLQTDSTLVINGRWIPEEYHRVPCRRDEVVRANGEWVALWVEPWEWEEFPDFDSVEFFEQIAATRTVVERGGVLLERPWDLVERNAEQLRIDYRLAGGATVPLRKRNVEVIGSEKQLSVSLLAQIEPFVVIDVRNGPVTIDDGASIKAFTRLEGPCHIGRESQIFRAQITSGSTIGPVCRIGGEVENSIVHGYANKYHDGFLGHSYVCPWVNIGAQSGTSDLKFDYSPVRVPLSGELIETDLQKVGSFIGDHAKTAVNSLFDTGTSIGVMSAVLPDGDLLPRFVPSFSRYWRGNLDEGWPLEKLFEIARTAMSRRNCELTTAQEMLLRLIYDQTQRERETTIARGTAKRRMDISGDQRAA